MLMSAGTWKYLKNFLVLIAFERVAYDDELFFCDMFDWRKNVKTLFQVGAITRGFHHCKLLACCKQSVELAQNPSSDFNEFHAEVIKQLHHCAMAKAHLSGCVGMVFFYRSTKSIRRFWQSHESL